jgi:hypothetical protein
MIQAHRLLTNDILWLFISSQSQEHGLTQLTIAVHSLNLIWATSTGSSQTYRFMRTRVMPWPPPWSSLWQVDEGAASALDRLHTVVKKRRGLFGEPRANPASEKQPVSGVITHNRGAKVLSAAFRWGVSADDELLQLGQLYFDLGTGAPSALEN